MDQNKSCFFEKSDWSSVASVMADTVGEGIFLFDSDLKIIMANRAFSASFSRLGAADVAGHSLCGALTCRYLTADGQGGAAPACRECAWFRAAEAWRRGETGDRLELRGFAANGEAFDYAVTVRPLPSDGRGAAGLCVLCDIAPHKRLRALERVFFHDVINLAAGVSGLCGMVEESGAPVPSAETFGLIRTTARKTVDAIQRMRVLRSAESGDLTLYPHPLDCGELMRETAALFKDEADARRVEVCVVIDGEGVALNTDREIVQMAVGDLLLNAIEASGRGDRVGLACRGTNGTVVISVSNPAVIPPDVCCHLFERSFTTRGAGRGLGAYRAFLLCERYLNGKLSLESRAPTGTVVSMTLSPLADEAN